MRQITIPSATYPAGTRQFTVDSFPANVKLVKASFSRESWPGTPATDVMRIRVAWGSDPVSLDATFPGGTILGKDGQPLAASSVWLNTDGHRRETATITIDVLQSLTTAVTIEAV